MDRGRAQNPIGVLGGSFNPVHKGHVHIAKTVRDALKLETVLFIPAYIPPHKVGRDMASPEDRMRMLSLALAGERGLDASPIEIARGGISYTRDTVAALQGQGLRPVLILGSDTLLDMHTWRAPEEIFALSDIAVLQRPGYERIAEYVAELRSRYQAHIHEIPVAPMDISSTQIRERIRQGLEVVPDVGAAVWDYIKEHHLYGA